MTYKDYTNEQIKELVLKAQNGDESSRDTLLQAYYPLAKVLAIKYRISVVMEDDAISVAWIAVNKAIDSYKADTKANFTTFASRCMQNAVYSQNRIDGKFTENTKLDEGDAPDSYIKEIDDMTALYGSSDRTIIDEELMGLVMDELDRLFTPDEHFIIKYYLMKKKVPQIAEMTQKSQKEVQKVIRKFKQKLPNIRQRLNNRR